MIAALILTTINTFASANQTISGKSYAGEPCHLEVISTSGQTWQESVWVIKTNWQLSTEPLELVKAESPQTMISITQAGSYDQVALLFKDPSQGPEITNMRGFIFQGWSKDTGLIQKFCKF